MVAIVALMLPDEDTVFARISPTCSMQRKLYFWAVKKALAR